LGGVSHKHGGRLPLLSARPAVTLATVGQLAPAWKCIFVFFLFSSVIVFPVSVAAKMTYAAITVKCRLFIVVCCVVISDTCDYMRNEWCCFCVHQYAVIVCDSLL